MPGIARVGVVRHPTISQANNGMQRTRYARR